MKKIILILMCIVSLLCFTGCSQSNPAATEDQKNNSGSQPGIPSARISFEQNNSEDVSYLKHVTTLWEQTKPLLREDLAKNYADEEYKELGANIDLAWVNLQVHSSFDHAEEKANITDAAFANITEDILMLIDGVYGTRDSGSVDGREESREKLRNGHLEYKINKFDETLAGVQ